MAALLPLLSKAAIAAVAVGASVGLVQQCVQVVPAGHKALLFDRRSGVGKDVKDEGMLFFVPWLQNAIVMDTRIQPMNIRSDTGTKDLQTVSMTIRVLFRPDEAQLQYVYSVVGVDYDEKVLGNIGNEVCRGVVAQYTATELITQREVVSARIRSDLISRAQELGILLQDIAITHLSFSPEFTRAIEAKQVAEQMAERQRYLVDKAKQEKLAEVILVEGQTEAARIIMDAMKSGNEFLELKRIEAAKEVAETLSRSPNISYLPSGGSVLLNISR
eukprot:TRINITY_DN13130_c1_g1_i1.p1 TRINITY_DN13130_c1_g1~~TRINITY_DN13130_c1_g1_i1.p1  ORF type:complete len:274 (-),score=70.73 TRINITY_DN13130_c1_g1_i1:91-912(-)